MLDSVVRIEQATGEPANILVTHNPDGTTSIEASAGESLSIKDEKSGGKMETAQFSIPTEIKEMKGIDLKVSLLRYIGTTFSLLKTHHVNRSKSNFIWPVAWYE